MAGCGGGLISRAPHKPLNHDEFQPPEVINRLKIFPHDGLECALFMGDLFIVTRACVVRGRGMVFRTADAIAMLLIGLESVDDDAPVYSSPAGPVGRSTRPCSLLS